jgi:hypothetical protein
MTAPGPDGETGRRRGLKIPQPQGYAGSSPAPGTRKNNGLAFFRVSPTAVFRRASLRVAGLLSVSGQAQSALPVSLRERRRPACPIPGNELGPAAGRGVVVAGAGHGGRIGVGRTSLRQKASDFLVGTRPRVVGPPVPGGRAVGRPACRLARGIEDRSRAGSPNGGRTETVFKRVARHGRKHGKEKASAMEAFEFRSLLLDLAERVGFEPTVQQAVHRISNPAHSTTLTPLRDRHRLAETGEGAEHTGRGGWGQVASAKSAGPPARTFRPPPDRPWSPATRGVRRRASWRAACRATDRCRRRPPLRAARGGGCRGASWSRAAAVGSSRPGP